MAQKIDLPINEALSEILNRLDPEEYRKVLLVIDDFIIDTLKIDEKRLPWRYETNEEKDWIDFVNLVRLSLVKIFSEYEKRYYKRPIH
jgi:hypothetical protein